MAAAPRANPPVSRRALVGGALAALALGPTASCGRSPAPAAPRPTTTELVAATPFYVAHRGGGGNWPEMTAFAYEQASQLPGLAALEISVCITADDVLVCSHDPTTTRVTGVNRTIIEEQWGDLLDLRVSAKDTTDPGQPSRPLARFDEVIERHVDDFVLFVEPKVGRAQEPLLRRLAMAYSPERIVWKQQLVSTGFTDAKRAGFTTWGYALDLPGFRGRDLERLAAQPEIDMLGLPVFGRAAFRQSVADVAADNGKKTIAWPITSTAEKERALALNASGLMTSNIRDLLPPAADTSPR